jgi:hypothetical protein
MFPAQETFGSCFDFRDYNCTNVFEFFSRLPDVVRLDADAGMLWPAEAVQPQHGREQSTQSLGIIYIF